MNRRRHAKHRQSRLWGAAAALGLLLWAASPAVAQQADSVAVRREARTAQIRFELLRRSRLPFTLTDAGARCEERIGRLCYWYDPTVPSAPREESAAIAHGRHALLEDLADASAHLPHDGWIVGQRIRYLLEGATPDDAARALDGCAAAEWWCGALRGLVSHTQGSAADADSEFARALDLAPQGVRCAWTDLALLLPDDVRAAYSALPCGPARDSANAVVWWVARPLHGRPGNDLRAEHHARLVMVELLADSRNPYGLRWDDDMREMLVRYGWSRWWSRGFPRPMEHQQPITGHERVPSFHFVPASEVLRDPALADPDSWKPDVPRAQHRYAPRWARRFVPLPAQLGVFRRGDSALVVAAWDISGDSALGRPAAPRWVALAVVPGPHAEARVDSMGNAPVAGWLTVRVGGGEALASLELVGEDSAASVARYRTMIATPGAVAGALAVSAPMLLHAHGGDAPSARLADVIPRMLHGEEVTVPGPVALYWETYGLIADNATPVRVVLSLQGGHRSWLRRLGDRVRGQTVVSPPTMTWDDVLGSPDRGDSSGEGAGRLITLQLPALAAGDYTLTVRVEQADGGSAQASRQLRVRRR